MKALKDEIAMQREYLASVKLRNQELSERLVELERQRDESDIRAAEYQRRLEIKVRDDVEAERLNRDNENLRNDYSELVSKIAK